MRLRRAALAAVNKTIAPAGLQLVSANTVAHRHSPQEDLRCKANTSLGRELPDASDSDHNRNQGELRSPELVSENLAKRWVNLVGNARSGTTILANCLNRSDEIYLMQESDLYVNHNETDLPAFLNAKHHSFGNAPHKGTYLPPAPRSTLGVADYLEWLGRHHHLIGEKVALGPQGLVRRRPAQDVFFEFTARHLYGASHVLLLRHPMATIQSMHKLWPKRPPAQLIDTWLRTTRLLIDCYVCFPRCYWMFFDELDAEAIERLAGALEVELVLPAAMFDPKHCRMTQEGHCPDWMQDHAEFCTNLVAIYKRLLETFSTRTFQYDLARHPFAHLTSIRNELGILLDRCGWERSFSYAIRRVWAA